jgi:uncharacterized protein (UPF0333 family)
MDNVESEDFEFDCCFCNNGVLSNETDPCDLSIVTNIDKDKKEQSSQWFFCHVNCFKVTIHSEMIGYFVVDDKKRHGRNKEYNLYCEGKPSYEYICYLCYEGIESTHVDPCDINIMSNIDKDDRYNQTFYFHANCFKPTLHSYMQGYFVFADD